MGKRKRWGGLKVAALLLVLFVGSALTVLVPPVGLLLAAPAMLAYGLYLLTRRLSLSRGRPRPLSAAVLVFQIALVILGGSATFYMVQAVVQASHSAHRILCLSNVSSIAGALQMYADDYGEFPPTDGWCDRLGGYVGSQDVWHCPERPDLRSGYALNSAVAGMSYPGNAVKRWEKVVSVFESDRGWNAAGGPELLPASPRHVGAGPAYARGDNYGFAGGESEPGNRENPLVAWAARDEVTDGSVRIFWNPRRERPHDGRGKPLPNGQRRRLR